MTALLLKLLKPVLGIVGPYIKQIVLGLLVSLAIACSALFYLYVGKVEEVQVVRAEAAAHEQQLQMLRDTLADERGRHFELQAKRKSSQDEFREAKRNVAAARDRQVEVRADMAGAKSQIQKSYDAVIKDLSCITGDESQCANN